MLGAQAGVSRASRARRGSSNRVPEGRCGRDRAEARLAPRAFHAGFAAGEPVRDTGGAGRRDRRRRESTARRASGDHRPRAEPRVARVSEDKKGEPRMRPDTEVVHRGRDPRRHLGAVSTPVYHATTILFDTVADMEAAERGEYPGVTYGLHGLPTVTDLQSAMSELEGGHAALAVASGLAAITLALLGTTQAGDHVLVTDSAYGPTRRFCNNHLKRFGIEVSYYDPRIGGGIEQEMRSNTRVVFAESPGSLSFEVQDVSAIAEAAHRRGALVMLDNTWATPLGFRAFSHRVDIALHAATKYIGGHSDVLTGLIVCSEATYPRLHRLWTDMGVTLSSDDAFLALRGLRTLAVRLERHTQSALTIARWLRERPE